MLKRLFEREIDGELIATFLFILVSGFYILDRYDTEKLIDILLMWMFPASVMVFLTLLIVKVIERTYRRQFDKGKYVELRSRN
ncbi:MAG: hypothetical protein AABX26_02975 [Nanoarchaeota archaeon]